MSTVTDAPASIRNTPIPAPSNRRRRGRTTAIALGALAYLVTFLIVLPLLWIALLSFQPSDRILSDPFSLDALTFDNYLGAVDTLPHRPGRGECVSRHRCLPRSGAR